jgi:hypothetical protein
MIDRVGAFLIFLLLVGLAFVAWKIDHGLRFAGVIVIIGAALMLMAWHASRQV